MDLAVAIPLGVSLVLAATAAVTSLVNYRQSQTQAKAQQAEEHADIYETYHKLIDPLKARVEELELAEEKYQLHMKQRDLRIDALELKLAQRDDKITRLENGIQLLVTQMIAHNIEPMWVPNSEGDKDK